MGRKRISIEYIHDSRSRHVSLQTQNLLCPPAPDGCSLCYFWCGCAIGAICSLFWQQYTYLKRRVGLFKKAMELSILCGCKIALFVFSPDRKSLDTYSTAELDEFWRQVDRCEGNVTHFTNSDVCAQLFHQVQTTNE